ncbi:hypothetical protein DACRYDRAFT_97692 [Dacryopinax primogenitus]|uniref:Translation initiation factor 3 N-terminal domain-containing protein n=1 Tax=Dacryopinax primogenitus (strain DJM 731) TaxID=1858805 RepID=M5GC67_DACPD|nr:uncharacterized protein DACRYDRAFT_97692 [Dacryopinax primogenitus]EJU06090.1 hypothetical protein DACRYDRAFT_97692 [Dacryopinax primogenitus]
MAFQQVASCIASTSRSVLRTSTRKRIHPTGVTRSAIFPLYPHYSTQRKDVYPAQELLKTITPLNPFNSPMEQERDKDENALPRNEKIKFEMVQLIDRETRTLGPLRPLVDILAEIRKGKEFVQLVSHERPLVKIITFDEDRRAERTRKTQQRAARAAGRSKEVQISWQSEAGDLAHKLDKVREVLAEHNRVSVLLSGRPKTPPPTDEKRAEMEKKVYKVAEAMGAFEVGEPERGRRHSILNFRPKTSAGSEEGK